VANIVTVQQVKAHLRYPDPSQPHADDTSIQWFIEAADEVVEFECDDILPHTYAEDFDGGRCSIWLRHCPIVSIQHVQEGWGYVTYELNAMALNGTATSAFNYTIDDAENAEITRRGGGGVVIPFQRGRKNIHVEYTTGEASIPGTVRMAELELIAHMWQNSQLRGVTTAGMNLSYDAVEGALYSRDTESGVMNINIGIPSRILEMLKAHRHRPFFA